MGVSVFLFRFLLTTAVVFLLDLYVFQGFKPLFIKTSSFKLKNSIYFFYWFISIGILLSLLIGFLVWGRGGKMPVLFHWLFACLVLLTVPKLLFALILIFEDISRLVIAFGLWIYKFLSKQQTEAHFLPSRRIFVSQLAAIIAAIPFVGILHGITLGKHRYRVIRKDIFFDYLPEEFDGYTITQISDIHVGSFNDKNEVLKGINLINEQKSDLLLFTGDLVNNKAEEMLPWIDVFSKLKAKDGVYSILGNHDYGDYVSWNSEQEKRENFESLKSIHAKLGYKLLLNESVTINKSSSNITLIGVENWGLPPFPQKGDIQKATSSVSDSQFKILMSHDPSHWDAQVTQFDKRIDLTLSGHTHGMQFGIEIPGFRWSPVKYKYPRWADLHEKDGKYLYVNRGFGYIGFHGRVGIWPEVTVITLKKSKGTT